MQEMFRFCYSTFHREAKIDVLFKTQLTFKNLKLALFFVTFENDGQWLGSLIPSLGVEGSNLSWTRTGFSQ